MKKKIIAMLLCGSLVISMIGCGNSKSTNSPTISDTENESVKSEYDIDEFMEIWTAATEKAEADTKYETADTKNDAYFKSRLEHMESQGFKQGQEIILSGCFESDFSTYLGYFIMLTPKDYEYSESSVINGIGCLMKDQNSKIDLDEGTVVKLKGNLMTDKDFALYECEILSPDL